MFKSFHRKQKSTDSAGPTPKVDTASAAPAWKERVEQPKKVVDEKETLVQQDLNDTFTPRRSEETMKETVRTDLILRDPPSYSPDMAMEQGLIDEDNLKAFGITMNDNAAGKKVTGKRGKRKGNSTTLTTTTSSSREDRQSDVFEMDVPPHVVKERRPELQVSIPPTRSPAKSSRLAKVSGAHTPYSAISPPSTSVANKLNQTSNGAATSQVSIISPLSAVESVEIPKQNMVSSSQPIEGGPTMARWMTSPSRQ